MDSNRVPGLTLRSVAVSLFAMTFLGAYIQFGLIVEGKSGVFASGFAYSSTGLMVLVALTLSAAIGWIGARFRLLTRAEWLCVFFSLMISAPIMSDGFWTQYLSVITTLPRTADFERMEAMSDKVWLHGKDLLEDSLQESNPLLETKGKVQWVETINNEEISKPLPLIRHDSDRDISAIRIRIPIEVDGELQVHLRQSHMLTVLARAEDLGPNSIYFCRVYADDNSVPSAESFSSRQQAQVTFLQPAGFVPVGSFNAQLPTNARESIVLEFGLQGSGQVQFDRPKLMTLNAMYRAYSGTLVIDEELYRTLPKSETDGLIVRPLNMFSLDGLKYVVTGYIPQRDWFMPILSWGLFLILMLTGSYCLNLIMRRQWIDSERYPLPMANVPIMLIGGPDEEMNPRTGLAPIWSNRIMWAGFAIGFFWCMMRLWYLYNNNVPDMKVQVQLMPYFSGPQWGEMWHMVTFQIGIFYLCFAIFMELNVLLSFVVGFFLYRAQWWIGRSTNWDAYPDYPFFDYQTITGFMIYGLLIVFFTRKYLWKAVRAAITGKGSASLDHPSVYRYSFLGLTAVLIGVLLWTKWTGMNVFGMMLFFLVMLLISFICAKIRAECGTPYGGFNPWVPYLFLVMFGGMYVFGAKVAMFSTMASFLICRGNMLLVPGIQMELIELGRRYRIPPWHSVGTFAMGILGGLLIGGWTYLSGTYSFGGDNSDNRYLYVEKSNAMKDFSIDLNRANLRFEKERGLGEEQPTPEGGLRPQFWAAAYAGIGTIILSILRQISAGFWFHPLGFILGPTKFLEFTWGSMLTAMIIRWTVLKIGGAAAVRNKLYPFFIGVLLSGVAAYLVTAILNGYLMYFHPGVQRFGEIY